MSQNNSNSKHKAVIFNDWILDIDDLKLVDSKKNLDIVWNVNKELDKNNDFLAIDTVIITDEKSEKYELNISDKIIDNSIISYVIQSKKFNTKEIMWEYSPKLALSLGESMKYIVQENKLIIAVYCPIATGSDLICVDIYSGQEIWRADVKQLSIGHSKYSNNVFIKLIDNKIILAGNEAGGNYIQVIDAHTGKSLFAKMNNEWNSNSNNQNNTNMQQSNLQLNFRLYRKETSKDSNVGTVEITILNSKVTISKKYGGFRAAEDKFQEIQLDAEMEQKIIEYIEQQELNVNLEEFKKTDRMGVARNFSLEIIKPYSYKIEIEGKTNIWGTDKYVRKKWGRRYVKSRTNLKNIEYMDKANSFIFFIKNL